MNPAVTGNGAFRRPKFAFKGFVASTPGVFGAKLRAETPGEGVFPQAAG